MGSIFDKWNQSVDIDGLKKDIETAEQNTGDYREVPVGTYEVKIEKMEIKECGSDRHSGEPMVFVQFRILQGDFENSCLFMNQLITEGWQISMMNRFLKSLEVFDDDDVEFRDYSQYNDLILDIFENAGEYLLEYSVNKKGYNTFKIKQVF